tara:strand:- start:396 stop:1256 length:861 start_codon:yes stop_codon:yes gene_type:complete
MMYPSKNEVTKLELATIEVPTLEELRAKRSHAGAGNRWQPIAHIDLIDEITGAAEARGLRIAEERYCVSEDRHDVFGFLRFDPESAPAMPDVPGCGIITPTLGFRHSNMQRMRLLGVHGEEVSICANGMISGDFLFGFKGTTGNVSRMEVGIRDGMQTWDDQAEDARRLIEFLVGEEINSERADRLLMEGMRRGVFASNQLKKIDATYREYLDESHPHHGAFAPRNLWSLYNAATDVGKAWSVRNVERGLKGFPRVLADAYGFELTRLVEDAPEGRTSVRFDPSLN